MTTVDPITRGDFGQRLMQTFEVGAIAADYEVPRRIGRMRSEHEEAVLLRERFDEGQHLLREATRAVKHDEERHGRVAACWTQAVGDEEDSVAVFGKAETVTPRRQRTFGRLGVRERQTA